MKTPEVGEVWTSKEGGVAFVVAKLYGGYQPSRTTVVFKSQLTGSEYAMDTHGFVEVMKPPKPEREFYIWSIENGKWKNENGGYTEYLSRAALFPEKEAHEIVTKGNIAGKINYIAVPEDRAKAFAARDGKE